MPHAGRMPERPEEVRLQGVDRAAVHRAWTTCSQSLQLYEISHLLCGALWDRPSPRIGPGPGRCSDPGRSPRRARAGAPASGRSSTPSATVCAENALGDRDHASTTREAAGLSVTVAHELHVDLQIVDREVLDVGEAAVAGAEVVQRDLAAQSRCRQLGELRRRRPGRTASAVSVISNTIAAGSAPDCSMQRSMWSRMRPVADRVGGDVDLRRDGASRGDLDRIAGSPSGRCRRSARSARRPPGRAPGAADRSRPARACAAAARAGRSRRWRCPRSAARRARAGPRRSRRASLDPARARQLRACSVSSRALRSEMSSNTTTQPCTPSAVSIGEAV